MRLERVTFQRRADDKRVRAELAAGRGFREERVVMVTLAQRPEGVVMVLPRGAAAEGEERAVVARRLCNAADVEPLGVQRLLVGKTGGGQNGTVDGSSVARLA